MTSEDHIPQPCLRCGYDLSSVPSATVCPECGFAGWRSRLPMPKGSPWQQRYRGSAVRRYLLLLRALCGGPQSWRAVFCSVRPGGTDGLLAAHVFAAVLGCSAVALVSLLTNSLAGGLPNPARSSVLVSVVMFAVLVCWLVGLLMLLWCVVAWAAVVTQRRLDGSHAWGIMIHAAALLPPAVVLTAGGLALSRPGWRTLGCVGGAPVLAAIWGRWGVAVAPVVEEPANG